MMRAIHLFPDLAGTEDLAAFRRRYDPLAAKIPPHVTLVFPFESAMADAALVAHVRQVTESAAPFSIVLGAAERQAPDYVWLPVVGGAARIQDLHEDLYTGPLAEFRRRDCAYRPHLTIGRVDCGRDEVLREARAIVLPAAITIDRVVIERILPDGGSELLHSFPLIPSAAS